MNRATAEKPRNVEVKLEQILAERVRNVKMFLLHALSGARVSSVGKIHSGKQFNAHNASASALVSELIYEILHGTAVAKLELWNVISDAYRNN
jgi:hypothetical protein